MKKCFIMFIGGMCILLCSCAAPPKAIVRTIVDLENDAKNNNIIIVSDTGKQFGKSFGESFVQNIKILTQKSEHDVSVMTYIEFIRSPYNDPDKKNSFSNTLFVFIVGHSSKSGQYGVYSVKYLLDAKYLDQSPFMSQEIEISVNDPIFSSKSEQGGQLARAVFNELQLRNIL